MRKKNINGLYNQMLVMTIMPLIILGLVIMILCYNRFKESMYWEINAELEHISTGIIKNYNDKYPGDYEYIDRGYAVITKGGEVLNYNYEYIDYIKENIGVEISLLYKNVRFLTTITDADGKRIEGTTANAIVKKDVLEKKKENFYTNVKIYEESYFTYYRPLYNADGNVVGMIEISKPMNEVNNSIMKAVLPVIMVIILFTIVIALLTYKYTSGLLKNIKEIDDVLNQVAIGDFSHEINPELLMRNDEFGHIGKSVRHMQSELRGLVESDALTQVYNRGNGNRLLAQVIKNSKETGADFAVALGDIDYFKKVNDTYGHDGGDIILKGIAQLMKNTVGKNGFVSRFGGEEFLIVFEYVNADAAYTVLERLRNKVVDSAFQYGEHSVKVTMTFGLVEGDGNRTPEELIKEADKRLYRGKLEGRNRIIYN